MAEYKIIVDSSCEIPASLKEDGRICFVPFRLEVNGVPIRDTGAIDTKTLLERMAESKAFTNMACPSPDVFYNYISEGNEKRVYIITIASKLSGCYMSALLAKKLYEEKANDKEIYVIDSKSISGGESQLALRAVELEEQGVSGEELKKQLVSYRDKLRTDMVLNSFEAIKSNVKMPKFKELVDSANNINLKENYDQLIESISNALKNASSQTRVVITHCNNIIGAEKLRDLLVEKTGIKNIVIMSTSGINSMLADMGGLIVSY